MTNTNQEAQINEIRNLFIDTKDYLKDYNDIEAFNTLYEIATKLQDFENENLSDLGDNLYNELCESFATEEELEETLIPDRLENTGAQGLACMLSDYDGNYQVHYIDGYGNIDDTNVLNELESLLDEYQDEFWAEF